MKTPFFLIDKEKVDNNILNFKSALEKLWPNSRIAYSVKTNSLPWLLKYLKTQGLMAEVVSDEEYELAKLCGFKETQIVFNGPIKGEESFLDSIRKGAIVNVDSKRELKLFEESIKESKENVGVRINVDTSLFDSGDVGYMEDGFRFGFSEKNAELDNAIDIIRLHDYNHRIGIHFHCNSITRSLNVYRRLMEYARFIIRKYNLTPSFIDVGGGFFGGIEGKPTATDYVKVIHETLENTVDIEKTMLIVEPGSAIIGSAVTFHTSVIDVKDTNKSRIVTTDGSRINIDPLWARKMYTHTIKYSSDNRHNVDKQIICGYTCMDHDRMMILENEANLCTGDQIIYERIGAYSMTFGGLFIRYLPEVYIKNGNKLELVRKRMETKQYHEIQAN